jgi:hypothetical protein
MDQVLADYITAKADQPDHPGRIKCVDSNLVVATAPGRFAVTGVFHPIGYCEPEPNSGSQSLKMKSKTFRFFLIVALIGCLHGWVRSAHAHGGDPRLEINSEKLNPGSVLEIRGVDFEYEEEVMLALVGSEDELILGTIVGDVDGGFLQLITLPLDQAEGTYTIRAKTDDHEVHSPPFTISGMAMVEGEGEGLREQEDGLLAPMPTTPPVTDTVDDLKENEPPQTNSTSSFPVILWGFSWRSGLQLFWARRRSPSIDNLNYSRFTLDVFIPELKCRLGRLLCQCDFPQAYPMTKGD